MSARLGRVTVLLVVLGLLGVTGAHALERTLLPEPDGEVLTLLLMGSDSGPPRGGDPRNARADAFQLLFVSGDRQHATFISVPRDSWVPVSGRGTTRINACLNGGPDNCVATAEQLFGIDVDGYLLTSMSGFARAVAAFGGLEVDVSTTLYDGGKDITSTGAQHLNGSQVLTYARDRKNRQGGDFARTEAQAELLALAHEKAFAGGDTAVVLEAATILRRHTFTDIPGPQLVRMAFEAMHLPPENVTRDRAPASVGTAGSASIVRLHDEAYTIISDAADDGRLEGG